MVSVVFPTSSSIIPGFDLKHCGLGLIALKNAAEVPNDITRRKGPGQKMKLNLTWKSINYTARP